MVETKQETKMLLTQGTREHNFRSAVVVDNTETDHVAVITAGCLFDYYVKLYLNSSDYVNGYVAAMLPFDDFSEAYSTAYFWAA